MNTNLVRYTSAFAAVALIFTAGMLTGISRPERIDGPGADLQITRQSLLESLNPTADQRSELEDIIDEAKREADSIMGHLLGEIRTVAHDTEDRMRAILTPTQNAALDTLLAHPSGTGGKRRTPR